MNWRDKYSTFQEFSASPDYQKWLEESLAKQERAIKPLKQKKKKKKIEEEPEIEEEFEEIELPSDLLYFINEETGETYTKTRKEWEEEKAQAEKEESED